jgi:hypothetical protein
MCCQCFSAIFIGFVAEGNHEGNLLANLDPKLTWISAIGEISRFADAGLPFSYYNNRRYAA